MIKLSPGEAAALLRQKDDILILTHRRPDGDTTGCAAGLCLALRQLGKQAFLLKKIGRASCRERVVGLV